MPRNGFVLWVSLLKQGKEREKIILLLKVIKPHTRSSCYVTHCLDNEFTEWHVQKKKAEKHVNCQAISRFLVH